MNFVKCYLPILIPWPFFLSNTCFFTITIFTDRKTNLTTNPNIPTTASAKDQLGILENISGKYKTDQDEVEIPMRFISGISYSPNISTTLLFQHELINLNGEYLTHRSSFGIEYELDYNSPIYINIRNFLFIFYRKINFSCYFFGTGY